MPLDKTKLTFLDDPCPPNAFEGARKIADSYEIYAADAVAGVAIPTIKPAQKEAMMAILVPVMSVPNPLPEIFALALATSITAFWMTPPVQFAGPGAAGPMFTPQVPALFVTQYMAQMKASKEKETPKKTMQSLIDTYTKTGKAQITIALVTSLVALT